MNLLVIHGLRSDSRLTNLQHATAFGRHSNGAQVSYLNCFGFISREVLNTNYDLGIITYEVLALRNTPFWPALRKRLLRVTERCDVRVLMPQDDYSSCAVLDQFVCDSGAEFVFTPITRDLEVLYPKAVSRGVTFAEALTGYWETATTLPYQGLSRPFDTRRIDLGQRVRRLPPQFGAEGAQKGELAINFANRAREAGFIVDVSTRDEDVLVGDEWWKFLGDIRFTVGRLGGASVADPHGKLAQRVYRLKTRSPEISDEEISAKLRWHKARRGDFAAISPRLFEAAAMGVCQILERDHYFDEFEPWIHYIPLEADFSNLDEVFDAMVDHDRCREMVQRSQDLLITSETYSYRRFVRDVLRITTGFEIETSVPTVLIDLDEVLLSHANQNLLEENSHPYQRASNRATQVWVDALRVGALMPESFFLPWISASEALSHS